MPQEGNVKHVKITIVATDTELLEAEGEVKAIDLASSPTIAFAKARAIGSNSDEFEASPGRYSYHFRVTERGRLTLSTEIDGKSAGPPTTFDATVVNAGRRYNFEVPS
jgi:hypothetical protein